MLCGQLFDGKYRVLRILGRGGMSTVYLAENIKLGTLWAIKEIYKNHISTIDILIEPNILKKLNHPALPRIFDILEDENSIYIIVDYIEGTSLDKELTRCGRFPEAAVLKWAEQICDVLIYLHGQKPNPIIYRDMKPSNIILTSEGNVKLIDFGIAREYKKEAEYDTIYIGTKGYAAPEQYGIGQSNARTDIYSLGVTLYHLITGVGPNEYSGTLKLKGGADKSKSLSKGMERIILKCTMQKPSERYQDVLELYNDLVELEGREYKVRADGLGIPDSKGEKTKRYTSFKKLVLTVWGSSEFACELAYMAARLSDFKILLINFDFISSKADIYLNLKNNFDGYDDGEGRAGFGGIANDLNNAVLDGETLENACFKRREAKNLYILTDSYEIEKYERYKTLDIKRLIETAYQNFDITILTVNKSLFDSFTTISLEKSDYNIIPVPANIDDIREFTKYTEHLRNTRNIPLEKYRYIAYEYKKDVNLPLGVFKKIIPQGCFLGIVSYQEKREKFRNIASLYVKWIYRNCPEEYAEILSRFNVTSKFGLLYKVKTGFWTFLRSLKKKTGNFFRGKPGAIQSNTSCIDGGETIE